MFAAKSLGIRIISLTFRALHMPLAPIANVAKEYQLMRRESNLQRIIYSEFMQTVSILGVKELYLKEWWEKNKEKIIIKERIN